MRLKTEQFHHTDFFELQFDTAALIIQSFGMIKPRGCSRGSNLIHYTYLPGTW